MGELEHLVDIELIEEDEQEEYQRLGDELAEDGHDDVAISPLDPVLAAVELQLHA